MPKAVRYDEFGGIDVLRVDEVERPVPGDGQVLVRVKAAGINPSEAAIRTGAVKEIFPSTFPSGQGSDLAGVIEEVAAGVDGFSPGDEVIGFSNKRASQAELVLVEVGDLTRKPQNISWEVAGSLYVAGVTAWGVVHSVEPKEGETVVISGAAGGVGSLAVQLARRTGATVIGLASESNHEWVKSHGVIPVEYGDGVADRIKAAAPAGVDAFIDTHGNGYVDLALALAMREELAFRGYPLRRLEHLWGRWGAILFTGVVFTLEHMAGGWTWSHSLLGPSTGALLFGMAALSTRGIAVPLGIHAAFNFGQWCMGQKEVAGLWQPVVDPEFAHRVETLGYTAYLLGTLLATLGFWLWDRNRRSSLSLLEAR